MLKMFKRLSIFVVPLAIALSVLVVRHVSSTVTMYGTLSNFDVINDTGQPCHGFEIELDGLSSTDVTYTFGAPYERYGDPTIVPIAGGVIVRYASSYDANTKQWAATTPLAPSPTTPTLGHQCWTGGDPINYPNSGCEHFGVSLIGNPTNTIYRWLVEDANNPGTLTPLGSNVSIPAPAWNVVQPPPTPNAPPPPPVVVAAIPPPPPEGGLQFGDAQWMKVFQTELPDQVHPDDLVHMVLDDPMNLVPSEPAEIEVEWQLLQSGPKNCSTTTSQDCLVDADCAPPACTTCVAGETCLSGEQEFGGPLQNANNQAVSRRFELYKYTGNYDPESHEALCTDPTIADPNCGPVVAAKSCRVTTTEACLRDSDCAPPTCPTCVLGETCVQHCSVTTTQTCATDADCSAPCLECQPNETCLSGQCSATNSHQCARDADCSPTAPCAACVLGEICGLNGVGDFVGAQNAAINLVPCTPTTCDAAGATCGSINDGCGGTLDCGTCTAPQTCGGGGTPNQCGCTPATTCPAGQNCGTAPDGCGGTLECGTCTAPQTCGGGGTPNQCGCTPATACPAGQNCGTAPDGCGGTLDCGTCTAPQTCGGGGTPDQCGCTPHRECPSGACGTIPDGCGGSLACGQCPAGQTCTNNQCVCAPTTCAAAGANCGTISDGCGGTLNCGTCTPPETCGGGGTANQCGCTPHRECPSGACGTIPDGCGGTLACGQCPAGQTCTNNQCVCAPTTCAAAGANCGTISDGCGGTLNCGTCTAPQTCGGGGTPNQCGCTPLTQCPVGQNCGTAPDGCGGTLNCGTCPALDQCHVGLCDPATGQCSSPPAPNGTTCNDGNACTRGDACRDGVCTGTNICPTDKNQCKDGGWRFLITATGQPFRNQGDCVSYVNTGH